MNPALQKYLNDDWELVRTTIRWHYIRNRKKANVLRGAGVMDSRVVRSWYEPIYLWARAHMTTLPLWLAKFLLNEK